MSKHEFTLDDLRRIVREGAGADDSVNLDGDILNTPFEELGYDSLALLETGSRIEREYQIKLDDSAIGEADTPAALLAIVNDALSARAR